MRTNAISAIGVLIAHKIPAVAFASGAAKSIRAGYNIIAVNLAEVRAFIHINTVSILIHFKTRFTSVVK